MAARASLKTTFILSVGGVLFSGYLSAVKFLSGTCAFNETCPYFLGYPACWYAFGMYSIIFVATGLALWDRIRITSAAKASAFVSLLGILFAGWFVVEELWQSKLTGVLGLSTCVYGLIFYILIFFVSLAGIAQIRRDGNK